MFNGTKQNVVASSDYECLLWGMKETGPLGGEGGRRLSCWTGDTTKEGIKARRARSTGCGSEGFWMLGAPGTTYSKGKLMAGSLLLIWGG